jgi:hypothetical protein
VLKASGNIGIYDEIIRADEAVVFTARLLARAAARKGDSS